MEFSLIPEGGSSQIIVDASLAPTWVEDLSPEVYHSDRTAVNSSSLKRIIESPFSFKRSFIDGLSKPPTPAMKFGTLVHTAILEGDEFWKRYVVEPEFSGLTVDGRESKQSKQAKEARSAWRAEKQLEGVEIVTQKELDDLYWMVDAFLRNQEAVNLLKNGKTEISGYYTDPETGIRCRFRPDFLPFDVNAMVDVKTVSNMSIDWFRRNRVEDKSFMYPFQMSMYEEGTAIITGKRVDYPVWILIGGEEPFLAECVVVPMEQPYREAGAALYHKALRKLKECLQSNDWPRRATIQNMQPSEWYMKSHGDDL